MDDAGAMREVESGTQLLDVRQLVRQRNRLAAADDGGKRIALHMLHDHVRPVLVLAARVDRDDVRMAQRGGRARLTEESIEDFLVVKLLADLLDGHLAIHLWVEAQIDGAYAAGADPPGDRDFADLGGNVRHR